MLILQNSLKWRCIQTFDAFRNIQVLEVIHSCRGRTIDASIYQRSSVDAFRFREYRRAGSVIIDWFNYQRG